MSKITIQNLTARQGEKINGYINVANTNIKLPVTLICGKSEGDTVLITAGVHCAEYVGIETAIELSREINPKNISENIMAKNGDILLSIEASESTRWSTA